MNNYKHFIAGVSNVALGFVHINTVKQDGLIPQVARFVKLIDAVKFEDGYYHTYYDEIKGIVKSFIVYWRETMDFAVKRADYLCYKAKDALNKDLLLLEVANTIHLWQEYEENFYKEFLPVESAQQQKIYDDLNKKFKDHMASLHEMKQQVEKFDRNEKVVALAKEQYSNSVELNEKVFLYAYDYLSMLLADHLPEIGGSLKEILNHKRNNLRQLEESREARVNDLINRLYDKNKEQLLYTRRRCDSQECHLAELGNDIDKIRTELVNSGNHDAIWMVTEKLEILTKRYAEFEHIANNLNTLKAELEKTYKEEGIYNSRMTTELPGAKNWCWQKMGANFATRKVELKQLLVKAAKALTTFLVVRSATDERTVYFNDIGKYSIDMFGHFVYHFNHELNNYHLDCEGKFWKPDHKTPDYLDEHGRYIVRNDEKIYQVYECRSLYKLGDDTLLEKVSHDCGHSEIAKKECATSIKGHTADVILPDAQPVDIKKTLNADVVKYLWDSFGCVLPDALHDVYQQQPHNPIHYLAHCLLKHKYNKTPAELLEKKHESDSYRAKILEERKEKAKAESKAWQAAGVQRRKPEESDDTFNRAVYDLHVATEQYIASLGYD